VCRNTTTNREGKKFVPEFAVVFSKLSNIMLSITNFMKFQLNMSDRLNSSRIRKILENHSSEGETRDSESNEIICERAH
jgi:hypothetical protein